MKSKHKYMLYGVVAAVVLTRAIVRGGLGESTQIAYANLPSVEV